jgi:branched-chain amino acid transport system ATP-binding protein
MALLAVSDLEVKMGDQPIIRGVNINVEDESIVSVLGANGVGKTTLMRAIGGIYKTSGGFIRFLNQDITNLPSQSIVKQGICQAPEGRQIFSNMTVHENLRLGAYHRSRSEFLGGLKLVTSLFPIVGERLWQNAGSLSGGEQQMLCLARALMGRPKLMLMDEPSLGLAPLIVKSIFALIEQIRSEGTPVLLVEQNAKAALKVSDYAYIMEGGKIAFEGTPMEIVSEERLAATYLGGKTSR